MSRFNNIFFARTNLIELIQKRHDMLKSNHAEIFYLAVEDFSGVNCEF